MINFKTKYIVRGADPAKWAQSIKRTLNTLTKKGYYIKEFIVEPNGVLIISYKEEGGLLDIMRDQLTGGGMQVMSLQDLIAARMGQNPHPTSALSNEDKAFIDTVMDGIGPGPVTVVLPQISKALASAARKMPTDKLRSHVDSLKRYTESHQKEAHPKGDSCDLLTIIQEIVKAGEAEVRLSIC